MVVLKLNYKNVYMKLVHYELGLSKIALMVIYYKHGSRILASKLKVRC
jgi:hypothetical protein